MDAASFSGALHVYCKVPNRSGASNAKFPANNNPRVGNQQVASHPAPLVRPESGQIRGSGIKTRAKQG